MRRSGYLSRGPPSDAYKITYEGGPLDKYPERRIPHGAVYASTDPVALDTVGWNVIEAESAEQALSMLDGIAAPDLVICDLTLPGISGAAFCRQVAERHPALAPRLVLTSGDAAAAAREVQRAALDCPVLGKPFSLADLERVVDSIARAG